METEKLIKHMREEAQDYRSGRTLGRAFADAEDVLDEAATALEQLQAENDRLKEEVQQMQWSPVEERLPEKSGEYLVLSEESDIFGMDFDEDVGENGEFGWWHPYFSKYGYVNSDWQKAENVTHWMPLPKAPKEASHD